VYRFSTISLQTRISEFLWSKIKSWHGDLSHDLFHFEYDYSGVDEPPRTETITFVVHKVRCIKIKRYQPLQTFVSHRKSWLDQNLKDLELSMLHEIAKLVRERHPHAENKSKKRHADSSGSDGNTMHSGSSHVPQHSPTSHDGYQRLGDN
jgi:hypothetical protein